MSDYSVLMSVYKKETPEFLTIAIDSMLNQTVPPTQFVLVCDGELTDGLNEIVAKYEQLDSFEVVRLEKNSGLGVALQIGLEKCKYDYVVRMDSDDYSVPTRVETILPYLDNGIDIVGSTIVEFQNNDMNDLIGKRELPSEHEDIANFVKKRSPFNHPSVAFKKEAIIKAGSYIPLRYLEDYYLWYRCIASGAKCHNVPEVLVYMRSGLEMRARRGGKEYRKNIKTLFKIMKKDKYISFLRMELNIVKYLTYASMPLKLKNSLIKSFLRKQ